VVSLTPVIGIIIRPIAYLLLEGNEGKRKE